MKDFNSLTLVDFALMPIIIRQDGSKTPAVNGSGLAGYEAPIGLSDEQIRKDAYNYYLSLLGEINNEAISHSKLVNIGYKWILKNGRMGVAFKEFKTIAGEIPDVIGFDSWHSIVVECKVSRSDFQKDQNKSHRKKGMGTFRFYLCPEGLIDVSELPPKWGLIYVMKATNACRVIKEVRKEENEGYRFTEGDAGNYALRRYKNAFDKDLASEQKILYSALRRLFLRGVIGRIYDTDYSNQADTEENELNDM